jgi:uncharacterized membrane protein YfcA
MSQLLIVALVMLLASTVRSALGFGEALIAVPLLALLLPVQLVAPVAVLASIVVATLVLLQDWRNVHFRSATRLVASTLLGIPLGLLILKRVPEPLVKGALGLTITSFSALSFFRPASPEPKPELRQDSWAWGFGFLAGILGGAYGLNGPPLAVYGSLRGWSPQRFRATLQGYFLPASLVGLSGFWSAGLCTGSVGRLFLWSLPSIVAGTWIGASMSRRLDVARFQLTLHCGLIAVGGVLILQAAQALLA